MPSTGTGLWTLISGPNTPTRASSNLLGSDTSLFAWTIAAAGACAASTSNVQLIIDAPVTATNAGADVTVGAAAPSPQLETTPSGGVSYLWSPASYLSDATAAQPNFTATLYPGSFTYTLNSINGSKYGHRVELDGCGRCECSFIFDRKKPGRNKFYFDRNSSFFAGGC